MIQVSHSRLKTLQTCERKYWFEYVRKIEPVGRRFALEFGTAWHAALSVWDKAKDVDAAIGTFNGLYEDGAGESTRTRAQAAKMLRAYHERWKDDELLVVSDEEWMEVPLTPTVIYVMRLDGRVQWHGEEVVRERKTTGGAWGIGAAYLKQFDPNPQLRAYVWGARKVTGIPYEKVLLDIAWAGKGTLKSGEPFFRYTETVHDWALAEFEDASVRLAGRLQVLTGAPFEAHVPNWSMCTQYGECPFRRLCTAAPQIRERLIEVDYQARKEAPNGLSAKGLSEGEG